MAGPVAAVLLPNPITDEFRQGIRSYLHSLASSVEGEDFWIKNRPFILVFDPDDGAQLKEYIEDGIPLKLGWTPADRFAMAANCNDPIDHRILGETMLRLVRRVSGAIDFCGALLPPVDDQVRKLYDSMLKGTDHWSDWEPHVTKMLKGIPGRLIAHKYTVDASRSWVSHLGDAEFLEAWLQHPNFHMVK